MTAAVTERSFIASTGGEATIYGGYHSPASEMAFYVELGLWGYITSVQ
jgi:hypothetical protein